VQFVRRRVDHRHVALAAAVPLFYVLLSFQEFNYFLTRFLVVPAVLLAPLFAQLFRHRLETAAYLVVASIVIWPVLVQDPSKRFDSRFGRPWNLTLAQAAALTDEPGLGTAVADYERLVPRQACVGAVLGPDEPGYLLYGRRLEHRVVYLSVYEALTPAAYERGLFYVVISNGTNRWAADVFAANGWRVRPLGGYWQLATAPHAGDGRC
jgi:hypothetical protein